MTAEEEKLFTALLFSHKHLWITFETYRYLQEHPEMDWETVHDRFSEEADASLSNSSRCLARREANRRFASNSSIASSDDCE